MAFQTLINGTPADQLAVTDRGLAYGDGLFETLRVIDGVAILLERHWQRLTASAQYLGIALPLTCETLARNIHFVTGGGHGVAKLIVTRGSGGRGYRCPERSDSQWLLQGMPLPEADPEHYQKGVTVRSCQLRLAEQPALAGIKHLNRLEQVMARREWQDEFFEGLMFSQSGYLIEATMANIFMLQGRRLITPALHRCGVRGVMREAVMQYAGALAALEVVEQECTSDQLMAAESVFICNSVRGIMPVRCWFENTDSVQHWNSAANEHISLLMEHFNYQLGLPCNVKD